MTLQVRQFIIPSLLELSVLISECFLSYCIEANTETGTNQSADYKGLCSSQT